VVLFTLLIGSDSRCAKLPLLLPFGAIRDGSSAVVAVRFAVRFDSLLQSVQMPLRFAGRFGAALGCYSSAVVGNAQCMVGPFSAGQRFRNFTVLRNAATVLVA
jgi:hypothetical protein